MNAHTPTFASEIAASYARPELLQRHIYRAWHQSGEELPLEDVRDLVEASGRAATQCKHGDYFTVAETDTVALTAYLHHHLVRKSGKAFTTRAAYDGGKPVREGNLYADLQFTQRVTAFAPVAPWRWSQDDPTGFKHGRLPANSPLLGASNSNGE